MPSREELIEIIARSPLFDETTYARQHPDVSLSGMLPAQHYFYVGARLGRDPGPEFDGSGYLETYLDVAARGENPLVHFELHGRGEGRSPQPSRARSTGAQDSDPQRIDVVVPVFNAIDDVKTCLDSLKRCETGFRMRVLVINDGSDAETTKWLRSTCSAQSDQTQGDFPRFQLIEHDQNRGYTKAVNTGLKASDAGHVVLLNSDTIVTPFWLDGLVRCITSDPQLGIVGPLSNAASWQNVPDLLGPDGTFAINALPDGLDAAGMAAVVRKASRRTYPRSTFVNGFCFMIRREVITAIGYMDENAFPTGYGEENDFCIRAQDAGFTLAFADDTYVFHAKSKSFGTERREALSKDGSAAIRTKHGEPKFNALVKKVKRTTQMDLVREQVRWALHERTQPIGTEVMELLIGQKVLFLLPVKGGGGGAHSVVQEAAAMRELGVEARIAVRDADFHNFMALYGDVPDANTLFFGFRDETIVAAAQPFDVVIATIFSSVALLEKIAEACPWILPAYYAQDYEPWFFDEGTELHEEANISYTRVPGTLNFAKTHWICSQVEASHSVKVRKVEPSIDHAVYYPKARGASLSGGIHITAMIRPRTPRRGAGRTLELLARLKDRFGDKAKISIFGSNDDDPFYQELIEGVKDADHIRNHGVLTRPQVADLLRSADLFIDMSDYQAFGRTSLEAMACGVVPLVPQAGGSDEYAIDWENALVCDTFDVDACFEKLTRLIEQPEQLARMGIDALMTASRYSPRRAVLSELAAFAPELARHRRERPKPARAKVILIPATTSGANFSIAGSGFVRLIAPYRQDGLVGDWETHLLHDGTLPKPGTGDIAILQRDLRPETREKFDDWLTAWRKEGGRVIYEIDDDLTDSAALLERGYKDDPLALKQRVHKYASAADVITVSTNQLATVFADYSEKIWVVPNYIDANIWPADETRTDIEVAAPKLKLGYVGTPTHYEDMEFVKEALESIQAKYDVEIEVIGAFQIEKPLFGKRIGLPKNHAYPNFVDWLHKVAHWDIGIIPLVDSPFNQSKSNLKFVEYAALNTAIVCSDNPEYRLIARDGENCLMVPNDTASWEAALVRLIESPELRQRLATTAAQDMRDGWTVQANRDLYHSVLSDALDAI